MFLQLQSMGNFKKIGILLIVFYAISCKKEDIEITKLKEPLQVNDVRFDYYTVKNYKYNDTSNLKQLDAFAIKSLPKNLSRYAVYKLFFYKYSKSFVRKVAIPNELVEWYAERILVEYKWINGKYCYKVIRKKDKTLYTDFRPISIK